jgi:hypothetical protein
MIGLMVAGSVPVAACAAEWKVLFDGSSFDGWAHTGPGYFEMLPKDKAMIGRGGMGMFWYYEQKFKDFTLQLEWRVGRADNNSGVFIRFPNVPTNKRNLDEKGRNVKGPWAAVHEGYEVQICDTSDPKHRTGSIYTFEGSTTVPTKPVGQWNTMEITAIGQKYTVKINGKTVCEYTGNRATEGYIGLQNHGHDEVSFRNIRVKEHE